MPATAPQHVNGVYAGDSRRLTRLDFDRDGDGRVDVRTYLRDARPVRLEADVTGDGVVDRWEYYDRAGSLRRIGTSSQRDGREDVWVHTEGRLRVVHLATRRDGRPDRREVYDGDVLIRAESDTNDDGLSDRWEEFRGGSISMLMLDEERRHGRATRRIVYSDGARIEIDPDGDGAWEAAGAAR